MSEIQAEAFMEALDKLRQLFPKKSKSWFEEVKKRFLDTEFIGYDEKGYKKFKVLKNLKLGDNYKAGYRVVTLGEWNFHLCTCMFGKFGEYRRREACTHVGAAYLRHFYNELLRRDRK